MFLRFCDIIKLIEKTKEKVMRKKFFLFLLSIFLLIPGIALAGCGGNGGGDNPDEPQIQGIDLVSYQGPYDIQYDGQMYYQDNIIFNLNDWSITIRYMDGSMETLDANTNVTMQIEKKVGESEYQNIEEGSVLGLGEYRLTFRLNGVDGEYSWTLNIVSYDLGTSGATLNLYFEGEDDTPTFTGSQIRPDVSVVLNDGTTLVADTDYTIEYGTNIVTEGSVRVIGLGPVYTGELSQGFTIRDKEIEITTETLATIFPAHPTYTGENLLAEGGALHGLEAKFAELDGVNSATLTWKTYDESTQQNVEIDEIVNAGYYGCTATLEIDDGYVFYAEDVSAWVYVEPQDISGLTISGVADRVFKNGQYSEEEFTQEIAAMNLGVDYVLTSLTYEEETANNVDNFGVSTATIHGAFKIQGQNNFTGNIIVFFNILPYNVNTNNNIPTMPSTLTTDYDGTEQQVVLDSLSISFDNEACTIYANTDYTFECANNINAGEADILVTFCGNYAGTATYHFTINKRIVWLSDEECWAGEEFGLESGVQWYNFSYDGTDHATQTILKTDMVLTDWNGENILINGETKTFAEVFSVEYSYQVGSYPNNSLVWEDIASLVDVTEDGMHQTTATISVIDDNFDLRIDYQEKNTLEVYVRINPIEATFTETTLSDKEYDGTAYAAHFTVSANIGGVPTALVEGTDYDVVYQKNMYDVDAAVNAGNYSASISFRTYNFYNNYGALPFEIQKKKVDINTDTTIIQWPTAHRLVWSRYPLLQSDGNITLPNVSDVGEFSFELVYNNSTYYIRLTASNFEVGEYDTETGEWHVGYKDGYYEKYGDKPITTFTEIINPFASFKLNGVTLTLNEIDSLESVNLLDKIEFTLMTDAEIEWIWHLNSSDYYKTGAAYNALDEEITIIAGAQVKELKEGGETPPSYEHPGDLWIYSYDNYEYESYRNRFNISYSGVVGSTDITINKNIFKTCKFGDTIIKDDNQDYTIWSDFGQGHTQSVENGDQIEVVYADEYKNIYTAKVKAYKQPNPGNVTTYLAEINGDVVTNRIHTVDTSDTPAGNTFTLTLKNELSGASLEFAIAIV